MTLARSSANSSTCACTVGILQATPTTARRLRRAALMRCRCQSHRRMPPCRPLLLDHLRLRLLSTELIQRCRHLGSTVRHLIFLQAYLRRQGLLDMAFRLGVHLAILLRCHGDMPGGLGLGRTTIRIRRIPIPTLSARRNAVRGREGKRPPRPCLRLCLRLCPRPHLFQRLRRLLHQAGTAGVDELRPRRKQPR